METEIERLRRENAALRKALTPSGETKYVHIGEYKFVEELHYVDYDEDDGEVTTQVTVPWTTVKEIMAGIVKHADITISSKIDEMPKVTPNLCWEDKMGGQFTQEELDRPDRL